MKKIFCILFISTTYFLNTYASHKVNTQVHYTQLDGLQVQLHEDPTEPVNTTESGLQFVLAHSGLSLRSIPKSNGQKITVIPFSESVTILEKTGIKESIEWMSGEWVKVRYDGYEGYIFSGFLSELPVPVMDYEMTKEDLDLSYPLLAWAENHFDEIRNPDTIESNHQVRMTQFFENGLTVSREESDYHFKVTARFQNSNVTKIYNLLKSMLSTSREIKVFTDNSVFIAGPDEHIKEIKIQLNGPVTIKQIGDHMIEASVITFHEGCSL